MRERLTVAHRAVAFACALPRWRAAWPRVVKEQGRDVLYATWVLGNDYRNKTRYYGAYPPGYLDRVMALFPDVTEAMRHPSLASAEAMPLHVFSGSLPAGPYTRVDMNVDLKPEIVSNVYDLPAWFGPDRKRQLVLADPPYSAMDAACYGTPMVDRRRALAALAEITCGGGHLVWLDTVWPMHRKTEWVTVGRITIVRSTNHRVRMCTIFERVAA